MTTPASYLSHIRRAFFLRVHPDRFRTHPDSVRKKQATAIQALQERIAAPDFIFYINQQDVQLSTKYTSNYSNTIEYYLEQKDGKLQKFFLKLDDDVEKILVSIETALKLTGVKVLNRPVIEPKLARYTEWDSIYMNIRATSSDANPSSNINHSFDINTRKGKNFLNFLKTLDKNEIQTRRASRIDASAAALVARQLFKFQSVDGTSLGWSSASLAKLLTSLSCLHDEHGDKLIQSFYPLRLVLSNDEFQSKLDLHGGTLKLNPQATHVQWLETLLSVTKDVLDEVRENRRNMDMNTSIVNRHMNIRLSKGHTCTSREFYFCVEHLSQEILSNGLSQSNQNPYSVLLDDHINVVIESTQVCRRSSVQREGVLRISVGMNADDISSSIHTLREETRLTAIKEKGLKKKIEQLKIEFMAKSGVSKVFRTKASSLTTEQYMACIEALNGFNVSAADRAVFKNLNGQAIGITGSGQSCQLYDDGSIILPFDWK